MNQKEIPSLEEMIFLRDNLNKMIELAQQQELLKNAIKEALKE